MKFSFLYLYLTFIITTIINCITRYTKDGRMCASLFIFEGTTYEDCAITRTPDGQNNKEEWCYISSPERGEKTWDYCKPILNYDKVREEAQRLYKQLIHTIRTTRSKYGDVVIKESNMVIQETDNIIKEYSNIAQLYKSIPEDIKTIQSNYDYVLTLKQRIMQIQNEIDNMNALLKHGVDVNTNVNEIEMNNNYNEKVIGNGLNGYYYDNDNFVGKPQYQVDSNVNFEWNDNDNVNEYIYKDSFSVKWIGYVEPPLSTVYSFIVETNDNVEVVLNNDIIIKRNENVFANKTESKCISLSHEHKYPIKVLYKHNEHKNEFNTKTFVKLKWKTKVFGERLIDGQYLYNENVKDDLKINVNESIGNIVTLENNMEVFKYNGNTYMIQDIGDEFIGAPMILLNNGINGLPSVDVDNNDKWDGVKKGLEFEVNQNGVDVYIAITNSNGNDDVVSLSDKHKLYYQTGKYMSLLAYNNNTTNNNSSEYILAHDSSVFNIYKKQTRKGKNTILFNINNINNANISDVIMNTVFVFFTMNYQHQYPSDMICGSNVFLISNPNMNYFKSCNASSNDIECNKAFMHSSNNNNNKINSFWSSDNEGIGAWISIRFNSYFEISKIVYKSKSNPNERNAEIQIEFSEGDIKNFYLRNTIHTQELHIEPPIIANSVKLIITKVYSSYNNGGHFDIYGSKCDYDDNSINNNNNYYYDKELLEHIEPLFSNINVNDNDDYISLSCVDSIVNSKKFERYQLKSGLIIKAYCLDKCIYNSNNDYEFNIYGNYIYSIDSPLCKAAYHSNVLSPSPSSSNTNNKFIHIEIIDNIPYYKSSTHNNITSLSKESNIKYAIRFIHPNTEHNHFTSSHSISFKFAPQNYNKHNSSSILIDHGQIFGTNNYNYGWYRDMSSYIQYTPSTNNILTDSLMLMIPDKKCKWCKYISCSDNPWRAYVVNAKYKIDIYVNDSKDNTINNFIVNGLRIANSDYLKRGVTRKYSGIIDVTDNIIIISTECITNCDYARSKMNIITLTKL